MPLERSLAEVLEAHGEAVRRDIRKCVPATVTAVHAERQTADVQIAINDLLFTDLGDAVDMGAASLVDVPIGVLRGGGFLVWIPVTVGDSVLLIFSDASADTWRAGDGQPHPPGFAGIHTADSPFAIPMFAPDAKMLASPAADAGKVIIGKDGAAAQIRISATDIELGATATDAVARASLVNTNFATLCTDIGTALGPSPITTPAQAVTAVAALQVLFNSGPLGPLLEPTTLPSVASTLVKCQ